MTDWDDSPEQGYPADELTAASKLLSKILRHEPELVGLRLDRHGWVSVDLLVRAIERSAKKAGAPKRLKTFPKITKELVLAVAATSDKQRFSLSPDGKQIRAAQGHSIDVELGYASVIPPAVLYHGTARRNWTSIANNGLTAQGRHAVHLSSDIQTAMRVGQRHGQPQVLAVDAARMHASGFVFSRSDNGVWLTSCVPSCFLTPLATLPSNSYQKASEASSDTSQPTLEGETSGPGVEFAWKSDRPSEDRSRTWHVDRSPNCRSFSSNDVTGKWCIFVRPAEVDGAWLKVKDALKHGQLLCAKVSTALRAMGHDSHVICVYTENWQDIRDVMRVRDVLRSLGFLDELGYKRDVDTERGIYGPGEWYVRA